MIGLTHLRAAAVACVLAACALDAPAATGNPDCFGYTWYDDNNGCSLAVPAFGAGAQTFNAVTAMQGPFPIQFPFIFYGQVYTQAWVSPAGFLTFLPGQPTAMAGNLAFPDATAGAPKAAIAVYWMPTANTDLTVESTATSFHVKWRIRRTSGATLLSEGQLQLFPDGGFRMNWPSALDIDVTAVGHQDATGTCGRTGYRNLVSEPGIGGSFPAPSANNSACIVAPSLLDCSAPTVVACGASVPSTLPATAARTASVYSCNAGLLQGNERVFQVDVAATQAVSVSINNPALTLMQLTSCDERTCVQRGPQRIDYTVLFPGSYLFVVDKVAAGGGDAFNFSVTCADPYEAIACGDVRAGNTTGRTPLIDNWSCAGTLSGAEHLYRMNLPATDNLAAFLTNANPDLWVVILDAAMFDSGNTTCRAAGRGGAAVFDAPPGDYVIAVDGQSAASGAYDLTVTCGSQMDCTSARRIGCGELVSGDTTASSNKVSVYSCLGQALTTGEDIYSFFNPIEQTVTARFVTSQPGQHMLLLPRCKESNCELAGADGVSCALFPPGQYFVVVDGEAGSEGPYSFRVSCSDFLTGVDLKVTAIDASPLVTSCQSFDVGGSVSVAVTNLGSSPAAAPVDVVVFEDRLINGAYDAAADNILGRMTLPGAVQPGETAFADVPTAGTVLFRDNTIYAMVDPDNTVAEVREDDNLLDTGRACEYRPPVGVFTPVVEWEWGPGSATVDPGYYEVDTNPLVADVNLDGIPDVVFVTGTAQFADGVVRVVSGRDGSPIWTASDPQAHVWSSSNLALADIDGVPGPEIIGQSYVDGSRLVCIGTNGTLVWQSQPFIDHPPLPRAAAGGGGAPAIADIDGDGIPEIVWGANAFRADGTYFWTPEAGGTRGINLGNSPTNDGAISCIADVDGDGKQEVIAGPTCYKWDAATSTGRILWHNTAVPDGYPAIGNFDSDDAPEVAITANGVVYLLEGDTGALIWQATIPHISAGCATITGGPPTVADFDGDCESEVGVAGSDQYTVFETDGSIKWTALSNDCSSHRTASSVFDFDGDGAAEVAYMDETLLHVFRGQTGEQIASLPTASHTWTEMITIADVDADNNAEIIMPMNDTTVSGRNGIQVIGDADDNWVNTRRIWNQHTYHITNINDDATVPGPFTGGTEVPSWLEHGTYRDQLGSAVYTAADLTVSIIDTTLALDAACQPQLTIVTRAGNGGGIPPGETTELHVFGIDRTSGSRTDLGTATVPDLLPGEYRDFTLTVPFLLLDVVDVHAFVDEAFLVNECREANNECVVTVDGSAPETTTPGDVGPALRAKGHGSPAAPQVTANWDWTLDASAPRPADQHFDIFRGETPTGLSLVVPPDHPWPNPTWTDSTPRTVTAPHVWYYSVVGANACEVRSGD